MKRYGKRNGHGASMVHDRAASPTWIVYTRLPQAWRARLMTASQVSGRPIQEIIRHALNDYFGNPDGENLGRLVEAKWGSVYASARPEWERTLRLSQQLLAQSHLTRKPEERF